MVVVEWQGAFSSKIQKGVMFFQRNKRGEIASWWQDVLALEHFVDRISEWVGISATRDHIENCSADHINIPLTCVTLCRHIWNCREYPSSNHGFMDEGTGWTGWKGRYDPQAGVRELRISSVKIYTLFWEKQSPVYRYTLSTRLTQSYARNWIVFEDIVEKHRVLWFT